MTVSMAWISASMLAAALASDLDQLSAARFCTGVGVGALARWCPPMSPTAPRRPAAGPPHPPPGDRAWFHRRRRHRSAVLGRILLPENDFQNLFWIGVLPVVLIPLIW